MADRFRRGLTLGLAGGAASLISSCSPLRALNTLNSMTPGDGGVRRIVEGQAYGSDPRQRLDVYTPSGPTDHAKPVIVFFYGGSWADGRRQDYAFAGEALAAKGFVVVIPDYRLVPQVRFPGFVQDGAAAIRWVRDDIATYGGDPGRISLSGHSAGAYIAVMVAMDERWLRGASVDPAIVRAVGALAGPYDFYPFDVEASRAAFSDAPDPQATQPINFARRDAPPSFLATGDKDTTVRPRNSIHMSEALRRAGASSELKIYPGLDHAALVVALSKPFRGKAPVLADLTGFLHAHTS